MIPQNVISTVREVPFDAKPSYYQTDIINRKITYFIVCDEDGSYGVLPTNSLLGKPLSRLFADLYPDKHCEVIRQNYIPPTKLHEKHYILKSDGGELLGLIPRIIGMANNEQHNMALAIKEHYSLFLKTFTHELLNICNGILGLAEIAETNREDGRLLLDREIFDAVRANLNEFIAINLKPTNLALDRISPTDIGTLLKEAVLITRGEALSKHIRLVTTVQTQQQQLPLARVLVLQALINLILNAIRYSPPGSDIYVLAEELEGQEGQVHYLRFVVSDCGIGIVPEEIHYIFEPDFRGSNHREKSGLGMGLHIVKAIVDQLHGHIGVNSPPRLQKTGSERGTEFWFKVPVPN